MEITAERRGSIFETKIVIPNQLAFRAEDNSVLVFGTGRVEAWSLENGERLWLGRIKADASLSQADRQEAVRMAKAEGRPTPSHLNELAWPLVYPDREDKNTDTALALRLIHVAVKEEPEDRMFLDTLAWALFENGLYAEAIAASEKALGIAPEAEKSNYQGYLDRLKKMVAAMQK
ncbi:MAG TPA: hypothetical protein QGG59_07530 [Planctomycetota bacterium]|nr:hypothetical protein [Planctomycetota bacterium]